MGGLGNLNGKVVPHAEGIEARTHLYVGEFRSVRLPAPERLTGKGEAEGVPTSAASPYYKGVVVVPEVVRVCDETSAVLQDQGA